MTCTREQLPLVTPMSAHHRSEISDRHGSAPRVEDVMSLRPGVARAMRPDSESRCRVAHGLVDYFGRPIRPVAAKTGSPARSVADDAACGADDAACGAGAPGPARHGKFSRAAVRQESR